MRHLLPISLSLLLVVIVSLTSLSLYQQYQVSAYQKRVQNLLATNLQLHLNDQQPQMQVLSASESAFSRNAQVSTIINKYTQNVTGDVSVYYKNLTTGESVVVNGNQKYYMASLYKVVLTLYLLERQKRGEISFNQTVGDPPLTMDAALNKVITESNNEYAQAIAEKYGWAAIGDYIKKDFNLDFEFGSNLETNVTSMGKLFEIISEAIKLSDTESDYLLQLLNHQTRLNKLPKYLPKNIYSHNKTGELDDYSHDAGLFYTPKANYILIFMSQTPDPDATNEQMALMSRDIYQALNE